MIVSEFGVCPPRASTCGAGPPYALIHASRYDTPGAPDWRRRSEVEPGYLLCKLPGDVTAPEFGVCPHTRTIHGVGSPTAQRRASDDDANARAKAFSAAIRDGTGSAVGDADGAPGWGRFQSTRFTDANGSSTTEQNNREACARALQADAFGNMVSPDLRPSSWREVRPGFTPYLETKLKGREWYSNPSHLHSRRFECGISICFMLYGGAESMSVGEMNCPRRSQRPNAPLNSAAALAAFDVRHLLDRPRRSPLGTCG